MSVYEKKSNYQKNNEMVSAALLDKEYHAQFEESVVDDLSDRSHDFSMAEQSFVASYPEVENTYRDSADNDMYIQKPGFHEENKQT